VREIQTINACRLLSGNPVMILTTSLHERYNAMPLSWAMPCSQEPPCIAISLTPSQHTYHVLRETGEFVLNIPNRRMLNRVHALGKATGRHRDKLSELMWPTRFGRFVRAPYLTDCLAHIECQVQSHQTVGDRRLFVAQVMVACADAEAFDTHWTEQADTLHYLGGNEYLCQGKILYATDQTEDLKREAGGGLDLFLRPIEDLN